MKLVREWTGQREGSQMPKLFDGSGNTLLLDNLSGWGINLHFTTNGGGAIHLEEYLTLFRGLEDLVNGVPTAFVMPEASASFAALGYYLASGKIAACTVTTGGAGDFILPGLADAKFHNIPALYLVALTPEESNE